MEATRSEGSPMRIWYNDLGAPTRLVGISPKPQEGIQGGKGGNDLLKNWRDIQIKAELPKYPV